MIKKRTKKSRKVSARHQQGCYCIAQSGYAILGTGRTPMSALRSANEYLRPGEKLTMKEVDVPSSQRVIGGVYLYVCNEDVVSRVEKYGGDCGFEEDKVNIW
jgi:hypothetical protein